MSNYDELLDPHGEQYYRDVNANELLALGYPDPRVLTYACDTVPAEDDLREMALREDAEDVLWIERAARREAEAAESGFNFSTIRSRLPVHMTQADIHIVTQDSDGIARAHEPITCREMLAEIAQARHSQFVPGVGIICLNEDALYGGLIQHESW